MQYIQHADDDLHEHKAINPYYPNRSNEAFFPAGHQIESFFDFRQWACRIGAGRRGGGGIPFSLVSYGYRLWLMASFVPVAG